jgi:hypothetical protein
LIKRCCSNPNAFPVFSLLANIAWGVRSRTQATEFNLYPCVLCFVWAWCVTLGDMCIFCAMSSYRRSEPEADHSPPFAVAGQSDAPGRRMPTQVWGSQQDPVSASVVAAHPRTGLWPSCVLEWGINSVTFPK